MMSIKLIKKKYGLKRFIKTGPIEEINEWMSLVYQIKTDLSHQSTFQVLGNKIYLELISPEIPPALMLEVIGPPSHLPHSILNLSLLDIENHEVLSYDFLDFDLFSSHFTELFLKSWKIKESLSLFEKQIKDYFHIVFNEDKIELHFFK